jgi:hypothetical protein
MTHLRSCRKDPAKTEYVDAGAILADLSHPSITRSLMSAYSYTAQRAALKILRRT